METVMFCLLNKEKETLQNSYSLVSSKDFSTRGCCFVIHYPEDKT